jgi:Tfp pilus assembly protein PilF
LWTDWSWRFRRKDILSPPFKKAIIKKYSGRLTEGKMRWTVMSLAISLVLAMGSQAIAQKKVALVIGNDSYVNLTPLDNPARDARMVGEALTKIGFSLVGGRAWVNLKNAEVDKIIKDFGVMAQDADIALFYFSGHGMQVGGKNYLLPIDLAAFVPETINYQTLNADRVVTVMKDSKARLKMVLLDACRTSPFKDKAVSSIFGLAQMKAPAGTVIGFATQPDATATQGPAGGNSPYASALSSYLRVQGLELFAMLNEVGLAVMASTHKAQQPWISASPIEGQVYLNPSNVRVATPSTPNIFGNAPEPQTHSPTLNPGATLDMIQRASIQLGNKDYSGARGNLTQAINMDHNSAPALSFRGFSWYLEGLSKNPQDALAAYRTGFSDFDRAIQVDPSYAPVRRHRGNTIVATYKALRALGKPTNDILDRALDDLQAATKLDPTSKTNANALGEAYLVKGSYRAAIDSFKKAIELDRSFAAPYAGICSAYKRLGEDTAAIKYAQLAADHDRDLVSRQCLTSPI